MFSSFSRDPVTGMNGDGAVRRPLTPSESEEFRRAVGRLQNGARELLVIALVMPIFLAGAELAAEGYSASGGVLAREDLQRPLDRVVFVAFGLALFALALRARLGAGSAVRLMSDALSDDPAVRETARARLLGLGGPALVRAAAGWIVENGGRLVLAVVVAVLGTTLLPIPSPLWLAVAIVIVVAMDVRWREMMADAAGQIPRGD